MKLFRFFVGLVLPGGGQAVIGDVFGAILVLATSATMYTGGIFVAGRVAREQSLFGHGAEPPEWWSEPMWRALPGATGASPEACLLLAAGAAAHVGAAVAATRRPLFFGTHAKE